MISPKRCEGSPASVGQAKQGGMVKAKPKEYYYEEYSSPGGTQWRLRLAPGTASGYYGVIKNKGKWQGMGYDPNKQKRRPLPGLYDEPKDAAVQVATFDSFLKLGTEKIPNPKKYAERGTGVCCFHSNLPLALRSAAHRADGLSCSSRQARS